MTRKNQIWGHLSDLAATAYKLSMKELNGEPQRDSKFSIDIEGIHFDFSRHLINQNILDTLVDLARASNIKEKALDMLEGKLVNKTEYRSATHMNMRSDISGQNQKEKQQMFQFSEAIRNGELKSSSHQSFTDVINIGIGGSELGPKMVSEALKQYASGPKLHFLSNPDGEKIFSLLNSLQAKTTLVILSSKSFTTTETMTIAKIVSDWLAKELQINDVESSTHFFAITADKEKAISRGIPEKQILTLEESIGGRYSIWSSVGFPVCTSIGTKRFEEFIAGGKMMDDHFLQSEYQDNIPVLLALIGIWYNNFLGSQSYAVVPYLERLSPLIDFIQQLEMESNGKSISLDDLPVVTTTAPIVWGRTGTGSQHSFFQLLHQGKKLVPVDLIGVKNDALSHKELQKLLLASLAGQAEALANGQHDKNAHLSNPGNKPSSILLLDELTPFNLGKLVALYENKTFSQAAIWNINPFDQWGVELGKRITKELFSGIKPKNRSGQLLIKKMGLEDF